MASLFRPPRFLIRERPAPRAPSPEHTQVLCYHCARRSAHSVFAETGSCPRCARQLRFGDRLIEHEHWGTSILTTGSIRITKDAGVHANLIVCSRDLIIEGAVHAMCLVGGRATVAAHALVKGGIRAAALDLAPGATIDACLIETRSSALGTIDLDDAARSAPGKGPAARAAIEPTVRPVHPDPGVAARLIRTHAGARPIDARPASARAVS